MGTATSKEQPADAPDNRQQTAEGGRRIADAMRAFRAAGAAAPIETMSAPAFRAIVAERLRALERELTEVRTRVNGLLFVVAAAAVTQVLLRLLA